MKLSEIFLLLPLVGGVSIAQNNQNISIDPLALNGSWNWNLDAQPQPDALKELTLILRVNGDNIYGEVALMLDCQFPNGKRSGRSMQTRVQGNIERDGNFVLTNRIGAFLHDEDRVEIRGTLPRREANSWGGGISVFQSANSNGLPCEATSGNVEFVRFQPPAGLYSGVLHLRATNYASLVTLEIRPGGLIWEHRQEPPFDWSIQVDGNIYVSPTILFFPGGAFTTSDQGRSISHIGAVDFGIGFPSKDGTSLTVSGVFFPNRPNHILITVGGGGRNGVWVASGDVSR